MENLKRFIFERELKYLLANNEHPLITEEIVESLEKCGYTMTREVKERWKFEEYFDDANFSLLKNGDILRRTRHIWFDSDVLTKPLFTYKENKSIDEQPYATRLEHKYDNISDLQEFANIVKLYCTPDEKAKLTLEMKRRGALIKLDKEEFLITHDLTTYTNPKSKKTYTESMIEVEDRVDMENQSPPYDHHLRRINNEILNIGLPIKLTKENKYERGGKALLTF